LATERTDILIAGAGVFGATAAIELSARGYDVILLDEFAHPHPLAASTDISKVVRAEYGQDRQYVDMALESIELFRIWNEELPEPVFHETGICCFTVDEMAQGGFEHTCYTELQNVGLEIDRVNAVEIARRFPAESKGARRIRGRLDKLEFTGDVVVGGTTEKGQCIEADHTVLATGAWTPDFLPELKRYMYATGHPVFHLDISGSDFFRPPRFTTFMADIARSGWYGFPLHPMEKVLKIARHSNGVRINARDPERVVSEADEADLRAFLELAFPSIAKAPIVYRRLCLYCDTKDGDFWIDNHPDHRGLSVASGGSGHGFKFAPILGELIADSIENIPNRWLPKFAWRDLAGNTIGKEASRFHSS
jgi:glycine/D-amino acid oxidase-like deaminating enzyme